MSKLVLNVQKEYWWRGFSLKAQHFFAHRKSEIWSSESPAKRISVIIGREKCLHGRAWLTGPMAWEYKGASYVYKNAPTSWSKCLVQILLHAETFEIEKLTSDVAVRQRTAKEHQKSLPDWGANKLTACARNRDEKVRSPQGNHHHRFMVGQHMLAMQKGLGLMPDISS